MICQVACAHLLGRVGASIVAGFLFGLFATAASAFLSIAPAQPTGDLLSTWTIVLATYLALAFGYWAFLNLNITSLRIRLLRELLACPQGTSRSDLMARYSSEEFLRRRLMRLENGRQMTCVDGQWRLESRTLLLLAQTFALLRFIALPARAHPDDS